MSLLRASRYLERHQRRVQLRRTGLSIRSAGWAGGTLAVLVLVFFGDLLFFGGERIPAGQLSDLPTQFLHWRAFGFEHLRHGHLPLWNPHNFAGVPFLGGFMSALLYPPNWLYLLLPLPKAVCWGIALHLFLGGFFMYLWLAWRRLPPPAALLGGVLFIFCGPHFLHVYAGHLPNLCAMAWAPLIFLAIDGQFERPGLGWTLVGAMAIAMHILAGQPQYVYCTGTAAALYCGLRCAVEARADGSLLAALVGMCALAVGVSAVQWLPGLQATSESIRAGGLQYEIASRFALPPENFLTVLAPGWFGTGVRSPYWGRCFLWEMSLFFSVTGLVLAVHGAISLSSRRRLIALSVIFLLLLLALGQHTPLFHFLYRVAPGFNKFRGSSKFTFPAMLFLIALAAQGAAVWIRPGVSHRRVVAIVAASATLVAAAALWMRTASGAASLEAFMRNVIMRSGEGYADFGSIVGGAHLRQTANASSNSLLVAALTLFVLATALWAAHSWEYVQRRIGWILLALALAECTLFGAHFRATIDRRDLLSSQTLQALALARGDDPDARVVNLAQPNLASTLRYQDAWGYDTAGVTQRYAELMAFAQGKDASHPGLDLNVSRASPLLQLARCRSVIIPDGDHLGVVPLSRPLPRFLLMHDWEVLSGRDAILTEMARPGFEPRQTLVLETDPQLARAAAPEGVEGTVTIEKETTDSVTLTVSTAAPAILLMTDAWTPSWRAVSLPGSSQPRYSLLPADYAFRAVPLPAGRHRLRIEYHSPEFVIGAWISSGALFWSMCMVGLWFRRRVRLSGRHFSILAANSRPARRAL
jgi:hypothetical protein